MLYNTLQLTTSDQDGSGSVDTEAIETTRNTWAMGYLTPQEVAKTMRRTVQTVYDWIRAGDLPGVIDVGKPGQPRYLIDEDKFNAWIAERSRDQPEDEQ